MSIADLELSSRIIDDAARMRYEALRGIDAHERLWRGSLKDGLAQSACATTNVEPASPGRNVKPVDEVARNEPAPTTHVMLVGIPAGPYVFASSGHTEPSDPTITKFLGREYGSTKPSSIVRTIYAIAAARELIGGVTEALKGFVGTAPPSDDITMLVLRWLDAAAL